MVAGDFPASHSLKDVAKWYLRRLPPAQRTQLNALIGASAGRVLRIGTLCSGTDSPIPVLKNLSKALGGKLQVEHTFSCEFDPKKREWILENFPDVPYLFGDVKDVATGKAYDYVSERRVNVPGVDILIAGFVCKSVSSENNYREQFQNCIREGTGNTGETFAGTIEYIRRHKPALVICENVHGLVKQNRGSEPVINQVRDAFTSISYAFAHRILDSRNYCLPHRRNRCWMMAMRGLNNQVHADLAANEVVALGSERAWSFNYLFGAAQLKDEPMSRPLNTREKKVVATAVQQEGHVAPRSEVVIDISKSTGRAPHTQNAAPCCIPNSRIFRASKRILLSNEQVFAVQGIFKEDFPALQRFCKAKGVLARDLAGNAFSTNVCLAVAISCLVHGPMPGAANIRRMTACEEELVAPAPCTPPSRSRGPIAETPPRSCAKRRATVAKSSTPPKRRRL